ncbi:MAG: 23S rRNA (guanosine(2251)-2'-O)-methyltransferase RlmB [Candidatus Koribacter versatilis]|uniref:23S rRNA (Guanosine(2251)-2'-O)-methyltransferase RlmB n=1 Tax=Candidatus Korobacter versatilis TaxID=658062 RepID=A0A932ABE5_9BACT|nr:23S rRNA (guanosine(2251)-2'-O)-methyltransferase RlmB [Candidatus Koribacter versatilis]
MDVIFGIHSVTEALKARARNFDHVEVAKDRHDPKIQRIIDDCRVSSIPVRFVPRESLDRLARSANHQGVVAVTSSKKYSQVEDFIASKRGPWSFLVVLDGVEDPHNLGAVIRAADGAGADGIIIPERRAVHVTGTVAKASAGASEHMPLAKVTNISRTLEDLKDENIWIVGLDERGTQTYDQVDYKMDCALVFGAEGKGLHEHVRKHCDFLVNIPMAGSVSSLNVSVASGIVMYEVVRQRSAAALPERSGKRKQDRQEEED